MADTLCIYHGNCADGFGAAWAVREAYNRNMDLIDFHPGVYQEAPPNCTDKNVIIVDFSYKRPVMEEILKVARSVTVLDHHKTAIEDLAPIKDKFFDCEFDVNRSGAIIAWHHFFDKPAPMLLQHIQDRDLWKFDLPGTREIQAALFSYEYDFAVWDKLMLPEVIPELLTGGVAIERKHFKDIRELLKKCRQRLHVAGIDVLAANLPYTLSSDAGHIMCAEEDETFGCCFFYTGDSVTFSLRSVDGRLDVSDIDVSEIAKKYGGGGHKNAAGFNVSLVDFNMMLGWKEA